MFNIGDHITWQTRPDGRLAGKTLTGRIEHIVDNGHCIIVERRTGFRFTLNPNRLTKLDPTAIRII